MRKKLAELMVLILYFMSFHHYETIKKQEKRGTVRDICEKNWNFHGLLHSLYANFPKTVLTTPVVFQKNNVAEDCVNFSAIFYFCWFDEESKSKAALLKLVTIAMSTSVSFTSFSSEKTFQVLLFTVQYR